MGSIAQVLSFYLFFAKARILLNVLDVLLFSDGNVLFSNERIHPMDMRHECMHEVKQVF